MPHPFSNLITRHSSTFFSFNFTLIQRCHYWSNIIVVFNRKFSGQLYSKLSLTVLQANNLALASSNCKTRNHYCSVELASDKCRTPSVKAKCWPSWNFQVFVVWYLTLEWILISSAMLVSSASSSIFPWLKWSMLDSMLKEQPVLMVSTLFCAQN